MSRMQCDRARELLSPYLDGELSADERRNMAAHIEACGGCATVAVEFRRIGSAIADQGREPVPSTLAPRVRAALARAAGGEAGLSIAPLGGPLARHLLSARALVRQAAVIVAACALTALATWWLVTESGRQMRLEQDVLSAHVRSLLQESPTQVASSNSHTVKPWFAGRVDFSPDVKDLSTEGFALLGGRLDYIDGRRVGALVYKRRLHTINVFMWPKASGEDTTPHLIKRKGFNLLTWSSNGLVYWAISDLNAAELGQLQALL